MDDECTKFTAAKTVVGWGMDSELGNRQAREITTVHNERLGSYGFRGSRLMPFGKRVANIRRL